MRLVMRRYLTPRNPSFDRCLQQITPGSRFSKPAPPAAPSTFPPAQGCPPALGSVQTSWLHPHLAPQVSFPVLGPALLNPLLDTGNSLWAGVPVPPLHLTRRARCGCQFPGSPTPGSPSRYRAVRLADFSACIPSAPLLKTERVRLGVVFSGCTPLGSLGKSWESRGCRQRYWLRILWRA